MQNVAAMIKPASSQCNMRCDYCFYCDEAVRRSRASYGFMSLETLKNVIRRCVLPAERACVLAFQGGEPTLRGLEFYEKAVEYAAHFNRKPVDVRFAFQTNGLLIDDAWCEFFVRNRFLVGVSVDGTEEIHDRYRHGPGGEPTYKRVMRSIASLDKHGADYNILTVVHREIAENIEQVYRDYRRRGWEHLQFIACLDPLEGTAGSRPYSLLPEAYGRFLVTLFDLWYRDYLRRDAPYIRQFENYIGILMGLPPESCEQNGRCGVQYTVEADGSVYPCDFYMLDEWRLGNLNTDRLAQIDAVRAEKRFCERSWPVPEECRACRWFFLCRNACCRNRSGGGGRNAGKNYFCEAYRMFFAHCADRLEGIAKDVLAQRRSL